MSRASTRTWCFVGLWLVGLGLVILPWVGVGWLVGPSPGSEEGMFGRSRPEAVTGLKVVLPLGWALLATGLVVGLSLVLRRAP